MRVLITGGSGFLGRALATRLRSHGHDVRATTSSAERARAEGMHTLRLGEPVDPALFAGVEAVVHAAHDLSPGSRESNVAGTIAVAEAAMAVGVEEQVYLSSVSAHRSAVTEYGLSKAEAEAYFVGKGLTAARSGLVIGPGGMFARMQAVVRELRIVPVVYPRGLIAVVGVDDVTASLTALVEQRLRGLFRLYADERVTMQTLLTEMRRSLQSRAVLVPVPYHVALASARMLELFGIPGPLASDSLRAMRANQMVTEPGDLARFVQAPMRLAEMVDAAR